MRTLRLVLAPLLILACALVAAPASAAPSIARVNGVRVGHHATFDRIVLDVRNGVRPGVTVNYVKQLYRDGSGDPVDLLGPVSLQIVLNPAQAHTNAGAPLIKPHRVRWLQDQVRETEVLGDYEGYVTLGVGLRCMRGLHVFTLTDPVRVVVDVAHC